MEEEIENPFREKSDDDKFKKAMIEMCMNDINEDYEYKEEPLKISFEKWSDFNKKQFPEQKWLIKNLIPVEGFVMLSSPSGEKKSWLALEMSKALSTGQNFLESELFETKKSKVLYINAENTSNEMQRRCRQLGFDSENEDFLLFNGDINLRDENWATTLKLTVVENSINVIIVDTFRAVAGGLKEEKADEVREFFNKFKVFKDLEVCVIFLDHNRKSTGPFQSKKPQKDSLLGSIDKVASVEILLMLQSPTGSEEIHVYQFKNRLSTEIEPFKIKMIDEEENAPKRTVLSYSGLVDDLDYKKDMAKDIIVEILEEGGQTTKEILHSLDKSHGIGSKNSRLALKELVEDGLIDLTKQGRQNYYQLTSIIKERLL